MTDTLRRAEASDLTELFAILCEDEAGETLIPPQTGVPPFLCHELATGEVLVAERAGRIIGFASVVTRGPVAFMSEFFVRKQAQSAGVGGRLLLQALPAAAPVRCTLSSSDPRALGLYIRAGLLPRWQNFLLRAEVPRLAVEDVPDVEVIPAHAGDADLARWDREVCGRDRPMDHAYWVQENWAVPLWFQRSGATIGYGYVQMRSNDSLWYPEALTVGPIGARNPADALPCALAAVAWACRRGTIVRVAVPASHPALAPLLGLGFRIGYVETFMTSSAEPFFDPACYIPSGNDLL